jgi:hypothetical protein
MQLKRQPGHLNQAFFLKPLDSDRVDVTPRSNVVGEDNELDRLGSITHLLSGTVEAELRFQPAEASSLFLMVLGLVVGSLRYH